MSTPTSSPADSLRTLFAHPGFGLVLLYRVAAMLSYQIVAVTVGWHIYEITGNPLSLGLIGLAEILPFFCIAPFAGYLVDHLPRRRLGMVLALGLTATALLLLALTQSWLPVKGVWPIYAAISLTGAARSFLSPVYNALFARALPREAFARGASIGSVTFQAGMVIGPALGGVLVGWGGKGLAYGVAAGVGMLAILALALLRVSEPVSEGPRAPIFRSIAEGAQFVLSNQIMLGAMALDMFSVLLGGAVSMLPAFIHDILHYGPEGLGILRGAPALGSIVVGIWLARHPLQRNTGRVLLLSVAGFGLCHHRLRAVAPFLAFGGDPAGVRHVRRRLGGGAPDHPATGDTRCHAWARLFDQWHLHRLVQRAGRVLRRRDGAPGRPGAGRGDRRLRYSRRGGHHRLEGAAPA